MIPAVGEEKFKISKANGGPSRMNYEGFRKLTMTPRMDCRTLCRGTAQPSFQGLRNSLIEMKAENPVLLSGFSAARG